MECKCEEKTNWKIILTPSYAFVVVISLILAFFVGFAQASGLSYEAGLVYGIRLAGFTLTMFIVSAPFAIPIFDFFYAFILYPFMLPIMAFFGVAPDFITGIFLLIPLGLNIFIGIAGLVFIIWMILAYFMWKE